MFKVAVVGDWHGNTRWAVKTINHLARSGVGHIIHTGDFGYWVDNIVTNDYLRSVNEECRRHNIELWFIDGNHEDHSRLAEWNVIGGDRVQVDTNLWYLPRGYRWKLGGLTWMALGGAHSVDRANRRLNHDWWEEEFLTPQQVAYAARPGWVDAIISHDVPSGVDVPLEGGSWPYLDLVRSEEHRRLVRVVVEATKPGLFIHGHYHVGYQSQLNGCRVIGLDRDGSSWGNHTYILEMPSQ